MTRLQFNVLTIGSAVMIGGARVVVQDLDAAGFILDALGCWHHYAEADGPAI